jgi:hypothetical protein
VDFHHSLKEGRVDCHRALVDGHLVLGVSAVVHGLRTVAKCNNSCNIKLIRWVSDEAGACRS